LFSLFYGFFSTIFALVYSTNSNIINNIKINNIKVSGLSRSETEAKFQNIMDNIIEEKIVLKHDENEKEFNKIWDKTFKDLKKTYDIEEI